MWRRGCKKTNWRLKDELSDRCKLRKLIRLCTRAVTTKVGRAIKETLRDVLPMPSTMLGSGFTQMTHTWPQPGVVSSLIKTCTNYNEDTEMEGREGKLFRLGLEG